MVLIIEFKNYQTQLKGEKRSKLLDPKSILYQYVEKCRGILEAKYGSQISPKRMDFHLELIKAEENPETKLLVSRAKEVQGKLIGNFSIMNNKAFVLNGPIIEGYGQTHLTIAYFNQGCPKLTELLEILHIS